MTNFAIIARSPARGSSALVRFIKRRLQGARIDVRTTAVANAHLSGSAATGYGTGFTGAAPFIGSVCYRENAMRLMAIGLILVMPVALGGCYTMRGLGQDVSAAGRALVNASDSVTGKGSDTAATPPPAPGYGTSAAPQRSSSPQ
jgi:predicted small secreted protein